jgi:hypothetical protein
MTAHSHISSYFFNKKNLFTDDKELDFTIKLKSVVMAHSLLRNCNRRIIILYLLEVFTLSF